MQMTLPGFQENAKVLINGLFLNGVKDAKNVLMEINGYRKCLKTIFTLYALKIQMVNYIQASEITLLGIRFTPQNSGCSLVALSTICAISK